MFGKDSVPTNRLDLLKQSGYPPSAGRVTGTSGAAAEAGVQASASITLSEDQRTRSYT